MHPWLNNEERRDLFLSARGREDNEAADIERYARGSTATRYFDARRQADKSWRPRRCSYRELKNLQSRGRPENVADLMQTLLG
jgi:hypothetical protein